MTDAGGIGARRPAPDLAELVGHLRDAGFSPDTRRYLSAHQLLLALAERGIPLDELASAEDRARFVSHMAPVFCANAEEQARFAEVVDAWLAEHRELDTTPTGSRGLGSVASASRRRWRGRIGVGLAVSAALIGAILWRVWEEGGWGNGPPPSPTISSRATPTVVSTSPLRVRGPQTIQLPMVEPQTAVVTDWPSASGIGAIAAALALVVSWRAGRPSKQLALVRLPSAAAREGRAFGLECTPPEALTGPEVRRLVGALRRPREQTDAGLDVTATVAASAGAGGLFTPINRPRRRMPVYVALLSRRSAADHQTRLHDLLLDQLVRAGVTITRYYFDDDPRVCHHADAAARSILLDELTVIEQDATLFLFAEAATCIEPISGDLARWVVKMSEWHHRVLFTPDAPYCWGAAEALLASSGFIVLPDGPQGLKAYSEVGGDWSIDRVSAPYARAYPSLLAGETRRWLDRHVPPPETRDKMLRQLRGYLGPHGFAWLAACAVYPEISWPLTLRLADVLPRLFTDEPPRDPLKHLLPMLARLPWFRHAYLPDWLRIALLRQLGAERERIVRAHVGVLLDELKIVPRDALEIVPLRGAAAPAKDDEPAGDAVYLGFMSGATLDPLGLLAPSHLRSVFRGLGDLPAVGAPPEPRTRWQRLLQQWRGGNLFGPAWRRVAVAMIIALIAGASATASSLPLLSTLTSGAPGVYEDVAFRGGAPVVAGRMGKLLVLSEIDEQGTPRRASQPTDGALRAVVLARDGNTAVAVSDDALEIVTNEYGELRLTTLPFEGAAEITSVSLGNGVVAARGKTDVRLLNLNSRISQLLPRENPPPLSVDVSAVDGTVAVLEEGGREGSIRFFTYGADTPEAYGSLGVRGAVSVVMFDRALGAYGTVDGGISLFRPNSKEPVSGLAPSGQGRARTDVLRFSSDGQLLAASAGSKVSIYEVAARREVTTLEAGAVVKSLAFSASGERLAVLTGAGLNVWELSRATMKEKPVSSNVQSSMPRAAPTPALANAAAPNALSTNVAPTATIASQRRRK